MRLPRDLLDEIELELRAVQTIQRRHSARLLLLEELRAITIVATRQLGRPVSAADLIADATNALERERRRALLQALRTAHTDNVGTGN
jgi:hypothetical protein